MVSKKSPTSWSIKRSQRHKNKQNYDIYLIYIYIYIYIYIITNSQNVWPFVDLTSLRHVATQTSAMSTFKNMKHYVFWDFNFRFTSIRLTTFLSFNYSRNVWSFVDLSSLCHVTTQTSAMSTFKNTKHYAFWDFNFRFTSICLTTFLSFFF